MEVGRYRPADDEYIHAAEQSGFEATLVKTDTSVVELSEKGEIGNDLKEATFKADGTFVEEE